MVRVDQFEMVWNSDLDAMLLQPPVSDVFFNQPTISVIPLDDHTAELTDLETDQPGHGAGRATMNAILMLADELGVTLEIESMYDENVEGGLGPDELEHWYRRLGFTDIPNRDPDREDYECDRYLVRQPRSGN